MSLFDFTDYRPALREMVDALKVKDPTFSHGKLAETIRAQKTFVSKVFGEEAHFNEDHMYMIYEHLPMTDLERNYLKLIYDFTRSGLEIRRQKILHEIHLLQDQWRRSGAHLQAEFTSPSLSSEEDTRLITYYLEPWAQIVHMYLTLREYRKNPELLVNKLGMTGKEHLQAVLKILEECGILRMKGTQVFFLKDHIHLDSRSAFLLPHQTLVRQRSGDHLLRLPLARRFVFNVTFSSDEKTQTAIREAFLAFSKEVEALVRNAETKDVYQLNFELFPWNIR
jgi:uncharacterized protein (TIGR02147 family)